MGSNGDASNNRQLARILVAEDEDELRLTLCDWLTLRGHAVKGARDGQEALDLARQHPFDVVLTDLKMPHCDGLHLLAGVKALDPDVAVIFISGQATLSDAIEALREGRGFDFLQKPLHDLRRLDEVIARALQARASQAALPPEADPCPSRWQGVAVTVAEAIADEPILQTAFHYIEAHFRESIGLSEVAAATRYSASYLTTLMRRVTGKTVQRWIIDYKLDEAQRLLVSSDWAVHRIAAALGYADASSFNRQFRKVLGVAPQAWRQQHGLAQGAGESTP